MRKLGGKGVRVKSNILSSLCTTETW